MVKIMDATGRLVNSLSYDGDVINTSSLSTGMYIIHVIGKRSFLGERILIHD